MKLIKFENTGCVKCQQAKMLLDQTGYSDVVESKMPYHDADSAILAGKLKQPLTAFPTFVVFDDEGNEVEGKRMDSYDPSRAEELIALADYVKNEH
jgi:thioredoxin-related protein